jgi:cytoskeletal protein RodZ
MPPDDINFQTFFAAKMKDRGVSAKKLAEATGIAPAHLEALAHGRFDDLPSTPYVHGYIIRLGKVLDFNGEEWWAKIKEERLVQNSGPADALPSNRFLRQSPTKFIWLGAVALVIIIYLAFQIPLVFGGPSVAITFPAQNPYTTTSNTLTLQGTASGADSLYLSGAGADASDTDTETITIAGDGSWQKTVLLQDGLNTFQITGKKLLGGATNITEQVLYQGISNPSGASTSTSTSTATSTASTTATASSTK